LTYSQLLKSHIHAIAVYSLASGQAHQITDGLSDARTPAFDASGKYLYFSASTNLGQSRKGIDMTGIDHPVTSSIYCLVLRKDLASPLAPQSDEEKPETATSGGRGRGSRGGAAGAAAEPVTVAIDFDQVDQRIVALPIAAVAGEVHPTLWRFDLAKRERERYLDNVAAWTLSSNGEKILYRAAPAGGGGRGGAGGGAGGATWAIVSATGAQAPRPGEG